MNKHILLVTPPGYSWRNYIHSKYKHTKYHVVCSWDSNFIKFVREKAGIWLKCIDNENTLLILEGVDQCGAQVQQTVSDLLDQSEDKSIILIVEFEQKVISSVRSRASIQYSPLDQNI